jgi:hypothetical protein
MATKTGSDQGFSREPAPRPGPIGGANPDSGEGGFMPKLRVAFGKSVEAVRAMPKPAFLSRESIGRVLASRRFLQFVGLVILLIFVNGADIPWAEMSAKAVDRVSGPFNAVAHNLQQPVRERSAFFIYEDSENGFENLVAGESTFDEKGLMKVSGFALHPSTMNLTAYRMDFDFRITSGALGWVVRASDKENYYGFKLTRKDFRGSENYQLQRYTVLGGEPLPIPAEETSVPGSFLKAGFNTISVRVRRDRINTFVNGYGVDHWADSHFDRGGVGFFASADDSAVLRQVSITGNEDVLGLILFGTVETLRSIREFVSAPLAFSLRPYPNKPAR